MTRKVVRTAVSLEPELLALLDRWVTERNSPSRSDAIRALIRKELADRTLSDPDADALGVVTVLYRHDAPNVMRRLTTAEHRWGEHVRSTSHVHLEGDACAEIIVLLGRRREVEAAAQDLGGVRGVLEVESVILTPSIAGGRTGHHHPHPATAAPH
ncbi:MAG: CopG family ribbon-helix-helix protein [Thermoplasmata archaeon]|nr:CopG family ribbon-helix-helix protein [Thermoplasmata archaeon]